MTASQTIATVQVGVLNATYQPLGPTKMDRAIALIVKGRAVIEEEDPLRTVHHKSGKMPWPLVIRMLNYIKVPVRYGEQIWSKSGVLKRDGHTCGYCGKHGDTVDHIFPKSKGGKDGWMNTVACCSPCNLKKSNRLLEESGMTLMITPTVPTRVFISTKK